MKKKTLLTSLATALALGATAAPPPAARSAETGEAPELGRAGQYTIGTATRDYTLTGRRPITGPASAAGSVGDGRRVVSVRFWYPAVSAVAGRRQVYEHIFRPPRRSSFRVSSPGVAVANAAVLPGASFPLVLLSHGYGGWNTQFSALAEHIASHGYVVASIEHADMAADSVAAFGLSFGAVLVDRTLDQRQILQRILADRNSAARPACLAMIDPLRVGLIGYSMGGYGALATAGADYLFSNAPLSNIPAASRTALRDAASAPAPIRSLILFAPWGGQPESRAWDKATLSKIHVPTLVVVGSQDDVTNYRQGVSWIFDNLVQSDRYMLVYKEARHNIIGNAFDIGEDDDFAAHEFLSEPVWRSDRLNMINQHFVVAFLDLTLKGDASKRDYLDVPTPDADEGEWPQGFGEQAGGRFAGTEQPRYWRGFQRRWAAGLELHHRAASPAP